MGATLKKAIDSVISTNPEAAIYTVDDLIKYKLESYILSIQCYHHKTGAIKTANETIPSNLVPAPESMKLHEVKVIYDNGKISLSCKHHSGQLKAVFFDVIPEHNSYKRRKTATSKVISTVTSTPIPTVNLLAVEEASKEDSSSDKENEIETDQSLKVKDQLIKSIKCVQEGIDDDKKGLFYAVDYGERFYWGKVLKVFSPDVDDNACSVEMTFLSYKMDGLWEFPRKADLEIIDAKFIFYGPVTPTSTSSKGYRFDEDDVRANKEHKKIQKCDTYSYSCF